MHTIFIYVEQYLLRRDSMYVRRKHVQADLNFIQATHIFQTTMKKYASWWDVVALITRTWR